MWNKNNKDKRMKHKINMMNKKTIWIYTTPKTQNKNPWKRYALFEIANSFILDMVTGGKVHIMTPVDDVANLELFSIDHKRKKVVMQMHKGGNIILV